MAHDNKPGPNCFTTENDRMTIIEHKIDSIHRAVIGDPVYGHRGLLERVSTIEERVSMHNVKIITWSGIVIGIVATFEFFKTKFFGS